MGDWKVGVVVAFWKDQVLTYMVLDERENMNGDRFKYFLEHYLYVAIRRKRIARPKLLMDNARYHFPPQVQDFIDSRHWVIIRQDPYSPDENPCDSHGFAQLKGPLRGRRFETRQGLIAAFDGQVDRVNENRNFRGIQELPETWRAIVAKGGDYVH
jgi:transposase